MSLVQLVVVPGLEAQAGLVDLNLLTRVLAPVHLRCVEIALVAAVVLAGVSPYWLRSKLASTLALLAVGGAGALRMALLPGMYEAWARVDRVAQAPFDRLLRAEGMADEVVWLGLGTIAVLVLMAGLREEAELAKVPAIIRGTALNLIIAGLLSLAFMGFAGLFSSSA